MKKIVEKMLRFCARQIIKKYKPLVIGIAGSVGKTSAKEAVYAVVSAFQLTRKSYKNYNNEFGVPLTIIGEATGGSSLLKWAGVFMRAVALIVSKDTAYPRVIVQEMGVDRMGDMAYLHSIVTPQIGVLTAVSEEHLEFLGDLEGVFAEERQIITRLPKTGHAVLNFDDGYARGLIESAKAPVLTYGFSQGALLRASDLVVAGLDQEYCETQYEWECKSWGTQFKVSYKGSVIPVFLPQCLGPQHAYAALAGIAVGVSMGINVVACAEAIQNYRPAPGRMRLIAGIRHTLLVDDTYNSSPKAATAALDMLADIMVQRMGNKKWAVLGDMRELGTGSASAHRQVGFDVAQRGIDFLVTVGEQAAHTARAALEAGMPADRVFQCMTADDAGKLVQARFSSGDIVLIKGSQGVRMERAVKELMADPQRAEELLVRQGSEWME